MSVSVPIEPCVVAPEGYVPLYVYRGGVTGNVEVSGTTSVGLVSATGNYTVNTRLGLRESYIRFTVNAGWARQTLNIGVPINSYRYAYYYGLFNLGAASVTSSRYFEAQYSYVRGGTRYSYIVRCDNSGWRYNDGGTWRTIYGDALNYPDMFVMLRVLVDVSRDRVVWVAVGDKVLRDANYSGSASSVRLGIGVVHYFVNPDSTNYIVEISGFGVYGGNRVVVA